MRRIPLRLKLTLAFTGVMAVLLAAAGIALSVLVAPNLDSTIDDGLAARAGDAAAIIQNNHDDNLESSGEAFAQVLDDEGIVHWTTVGAGKRPLLTPSELARAR